MYAYYYLGFCLAVTLTGVFTLVNPIFKELQNRGYEVHPAGYLITVSIYSIITYITAPIMLYRVLTGPTDQMVEDLVAKIEAENLLDDEDE